MTPLVDDDREALHRDLARGLAAGLAAAVASLVARVVTTHDLPGFAPEEVLAPGVLARALGWALGLAPAWAAGAVVMRRAGRLAGAVAAGLVAPLAALGGRFLELLLETRAVDVATDALLGGTNAAVLPATGLDLAAATCAGAAVLGPLLAARRVGAGLAWELAAPLGGALVASACLGLAIVHGLDLGLGRAPTTALVGQVVAVIGGLVLGARVVDAALAWLDRARGRGTPGRSSARRRRSAGAIALGACALGWASVGAAREELEVAPLRLLPWPREPEALLALARAIEGDVHFGPGLVLIRERRELDSVGPTRLPTTHVAPTRADHALEARRRAARLGSLAAMRRVGEVLIARAESRWGVERSTDSRPGYTAAEHVRRGAQRLEGLDWLRRAAALGSAPDRRALAAHLGPTDDEAREALDALLRDLGGPRGDDPVSAFRAAYLLPAASPRQRLAILDALRRIAWGPPAPAEVRRARALEQLQRDQDAPPRTTIHHISATGAPVPVDPPPVEPEAASFLLALAPAEAVTCEAFAAARGMVELLGDQRRRRLADRTFRLEHEAWTVRSAGDAARRVGLGDPLRLWPDPRRAGASVRDDLTRARDDARAGRLLDAWTRLGEVVRGEPHAGVAHAARALTYLAIVARRTPLLEVHLDVARSLASVPTSLDELDPEVIAVQAALDGWWATASGDDGRAVWAVERLHLVARWRPADLRTPLRRLLLQRRLARNVAAFASFAGGAPGLDAARRALAERLRMRADGHRAARRLAEAAPLYAAAVAWWPDDAAAWAALYELATERGDLAALFRASVALERLGVCPPGAPTLPGAWR